MGRDAKLLIMLFSILYMYVITVHMCTSGSQFKPRVLMLLPRVLLYLSTSKVECQCPALISLSNDIIYLYIFLCFRKLFNLGNYLIIEYWYPIIGIAVFEYF